MRIPFGEWAPDLAELDSSVAAVAHNVFAGANAYQPIPGPEPYSDALPAPARGLFLARSKSGTPVAFAGTGGTLQRLTDLTWSEVGSGYAVPTDELWSFAQFGSTVIATNIADGPQAFDLDGGSAFTPLGGSPPRARFVDVIEDYVVLGALEDDPFAIAWSDTNDAEEWSAGNAGGQSFADGGRVQNVSGAAGLVIQESVVRRMIHAPGSAEVFQFHKLEQARGTVAPNSVIKFGPTVAYLAEDGFWFDGQPIGLNKVNRTFFADVDPARLFGVIGAFDPVRPVFYWLYPGAAQDPDDPLRNRGLAYNWHAGRWSSFDADFSVIANVATLGITLEGLSALYPSIEDIPFSLDSRVWQGGRPVFGAIGSDMKLSFFDGAPLEATLETGEMQLIPGRRATVRSLRPLVEMTGPAAAAVASARKRERQVSTGSWTAEAAMQPSGACPLRSSGRLHRFRIRIPDGTDWTHAQGVEVTAAASGTR